MQDFLRLKVLLDMQSLFSWIYSVFNTISIKVFNIDDVKQARKKQDIFGLACCGC